MHPQLFQHCFSADEITACNPASLLELISRSQLRDPLFLRQFQGRLLFTFEGHGLQEWVHSDPQVRRFCRALHRQWPYWLWFSTLHTHALADMLYACLPNLVALQRDELSQLDLSFRHQDFQRIMRPLHQRFCALGLRAGWSQRRIATRMAQIGDYLGLSPEAPRQV